MQSTNPYESPHAPPEQAAWRWRPKVTIVEAIVICGIIAVLISLLLPAVESGPHPRRNRSPTTETPKSGE